jgi:acyl transferase domain-containing protein
MLSSCGDSGMLATDTTPQKIQEVSKKVGVEVHIANVNAPDQTVVGGRREHLAALAHALSAASHQARMLSVPAAFHTPLMSGASRLLEQLLATSAIQTPHTAAMSTVTNVLVRDAADIRRNLIRKLRTGETIFDGILGYVPGVAGMHDMRFCISASAGTHGCIGC